MQPAPLLALAAHVVVEPAGAFAPSMKTAAPVVPCETYATFRNLLASLASRGTRITIVPCAVAITGALGLVLGRANERKAAGLPLELPPAHALKHEPASTAAAKLLGPRASATAMRAALATGLRTFKCEPAGLVGFHTHRSSATCYRYRHMPQQIT